MRRPSRKTALPPGQYWTPVAGQFWAPVDSLGAVGTVLYLSYDVAGPALNSELTTFLTNYLDSPTTLGTWFYDYARPVIEDTLDPWSWSDPYAIGTEYSSWDTDDWDTGDSDTDDWDTDDWDTGDSDTGDSDTGRGGAGGGYGGRPGRGANNLDNLVNRPSPLPGGKPEIPDCVRQPKKC